MKKLKIFSGVCLLTAVLLFTGGYSYSYQLSLQAKQAVADSNSSDQNADQNYPDSSNVSGNSDYGYQPYNNNNYEYYSPYVFEYPYWDSPFYDPFIWNPYGLWAFSPGFYYGAFGFYPYNHNFRYGGYGYGYGHNGITGSRDEGNIRNAGSSGRISGINSNHLVLPSTARTLKAGTKANASHVAKINKLSRINSRIMSNRSAMQKRYTYNNSNRGGSRSASHFNSLSSPGSSGSYRRSSGGGGRSGGSGRSGGGRR